MSVFKDKVLLITGGTGSFGNAVLNRFLRTDIGEIRIFSRDEKKQDDMRHDFQARMSEVAHKIKFYIGDVRNKSTLHYAMQGVNYVFHAAALKQVPSCEFFPLEAELTKYMHNVFGAYKVTYFNACREYCEQMGGDWRKVHTGMLLSGYINDTHTYVPGPDGKFGYGGKCFPKDVNAFAKMTKGTPLGTLLEHLHELNVHFRGFEEHI